MSFYFGYQNPRFSRQRKEDHVFFDAKTNRTLMQFDVVGLSEFFTAPRPLYRKSVEKLTRENLANRQSFLKAEWIQAELLCEEIERTKELMEKYDYVDVHDSEENCPCEVRAAMKDPLPYWLLIRDRALAIIGCGYTMYQASIELEQAMADQTYQEKIVDYTVDHMQQEIEGYKIEIQSLRRELASLNNK